jgi:hypothetical protein
MRAPQLQSSFEVLNSDSVDHRERSRERLDEVFRRSSRRAEGDLANEHDGRRYVGVDDLRRVEEKVGRSGTSSSVCASARSTSMCASTRSIECRCVRISLTTSDVRPRRTAAPESVLEIARSPAAAAVRRRQKHDADHRHSAENVAHDTRCRAGAARCSSGAASMTMVAKERAGVWKRAHHRIVTHNVVDMHVWRH